MHMDGKGSKNNSMNQYIFILTRKRTTTETSLPDIGGEHSTSSCSVLSSFEKSCQTELHRSRSVSEGDNGMMQCVCRRHASNGKPLRKIKKG